MPRRTEIKCDGPDCVATRWEPPYENHSWISGGIWDTDLSKIEIYLNADKAEAWDPEQRFDWCGVACMHKHIDKILIEHKVAKPLIGSAR